MFKLGLDYKSYYQLPCEPPSVFPGGCNGCPGCAPPLIPFNESLDWLKNYSMLVDGLPITPILVGWQGNGTLSTLLCISLTSAASAVQCSAFLLNSLTHRPRDVGFLLTGHDSLYPGLDVVNAELGGSAGLNKLVADTKRLYSATMSYHIDVDISNSMTPTQVSRQKHSLMIMVATQQCFCFNEIGNARLCPLDFGQKTERCSRLCVFAAL